MFAIAANFKEIQEGIMNRTNIRSGMNIIVGYACSITEGY